MTDCYLVTCLGCHLYESRSKLDDARLLKNIHDDQPGCLAVLRRFQSDE